MWHWALFFLGLTLLAALAVFGSTSAAAFATAARPVFYGAAALFMVSVVGIFTRRV